MPSLISSFIIVAAISFYVGLYLTEPNKMPRRQHTMFYIALFTMVLGLINSLWFTMVFYSYINR